MDSKNSILINEIEQIRNSVNSFTMQFLNLLEELDSIKSSKILREIQKLDSEVLNLSEMLHMDTNRSKIDILNEIELIRAKNNKHWMDVVRLCFELDEKRAQSIFYNIKECDKEIRNLTKEISEL